MSKTDPYCYPPEKGALGWHDDRDWLDCLFDEWRAGADTLTGIHRVIYLCGSPFPTRYEFGHSNRSVNTYRFPIPSKWFKPCMRTRTAYLTAQLERLINRSVRTPN